MTATLTCDNARAQLVAVSDAVVAAKATSGSNGFKKLTGSARDCGATYD
jgi:hypothetical protein